MEKIYPFLPIFGITRVANITGLDRLGIPVATAIRPNSRSLAVSQGKGTTLISAKVSAIMEAVEGYHAERLFVPTCLASYEDMVSRHKMANLKFVSRSRKRALKETTKLIWNQGRELLQNEDIWLPHELIHTDYTLPSSIERGYFISDSNGLASGNTKLEAINHGLYEVIERDALALWHSLPAIKKADKKVDLRTIEDEDCQAMVSKFQENRIAIAVWNITTDIGIPAFICKCVSQEDSGLLTIRPVYGSGCHNNKNVALSRAITEAAQSRATFIAGARDDQYRSVYHEHLSDEVVRKWRADIGDAPGPKDFRLLGSIEFETIQNDHEYILQRLHQIGLRQVIYVDLTREEFGIPVVKVVVPGLESITGGDARIPGQRLINYQRTNSEEIYA